MVSECDAKLEACVDNVVASLNTLLGEKHDSITSENKLASTLISTAVDETLDQTLTSISSTLTKKADLASPAFTGTPDFTSVSGITGLTKSHVGLGNVDNTSDTAKPVSTAQQTALNLKANLASPSISGQATFICIREKITGNGFGASYMWCNADAGSVFYGTSSPVNDFSMIINNIPAESSPNYHQT